MSEYSEEPFEIWIHHNHVSYLNHEGSDFYAMLNRVRTLWRMGHYATITRTSDDITLVQPHKKAYRWNR